MLEEAIKIPKHVAIIPDGNRRWAVDKGFPTFEGHRRGFDMAVEIGRTARKLGIHTLTLWAFSTENWNRSKAEVKYLMDLYRVMIDKNLKEAKKDGVRIYHLGRKDRIPRGLAKKIENAEKETSTFNKFVLNIALDYGGHDEILRAVTKLCTDVTADKLKVEDLYKVVGKYQGKYPEYFFKSYLDTKDQPNPYVDFLIRTSGEQRISGYLSWQAAYAEYYFPKYHFPDFTPQRFKEAIDIFSSRKRRFGGDDGSRKYIAK